MEYKLGKDNKCSKTKNCAESYNGTCIVCDDNYYLGYDNLCSDVEHCIYSDYHSCIECENNYYYDTTYKVCRIAEGIFENCKSGYYTLFCEVCKDDYYHNHTDYLCYSNKENNEFYKCSKTDFFCEYCIECTKGYYLGNKDNKCSLIEGCSISENENICIECDIDYCLDVKNNKCISNYEIINEEKKYYFKCKKINKEGTSCEECIDGYILNKNGLCVDYEHCEERNEDNSCKKCQNDIHGYYCLNNNFGCVEIFNKQYCLECNNILDFYNCTKCFDGYHLDNKGNCYKNE